jgi:HEAT repeat protein
VRPLAEGVRDSATRIQARDALVRHGDPATVKVLEALVDRIRDPEFQRSTVEALGKSVAAEATEALLRLARHKAPEIRAAAARGLAEREPGGAVEQALVALTEDEQRPVAVAALVALREAGTSACVQRLLEVASTARDVHQKTAALGTLGRHAPERCRDLVTQLLEVNDDRLRAAAIEALGGSLADHMQDAPLLTPALKDADARVRGNAIVALWEIDPDACRKPFFDMMKSPKTEHRATAAWVLKKVQVAELLQAFLPLVNTEADPGVLRLAIEAIEGIDTPRLAPLLGRLLTHPNKAVRAAATTSFARVGRRSERPLLTKALNKERDPETRAGMVRALGHLSDSSDLPDLIPFLDDPEGVVVSQALEALSEVGDLAAVPILEERANHGSPLVQAHARAGLVGMGRLEVITDITKAIAGSEAPDAPCLALERVGELLRAAIEGGGQPLLVSALDARAPAEGATLVPVAPPKPIEPPQKQKDDWEEEFVSALVQGAPTEKLQEMGKQRPAAYMARYLARRHVGGVPSPAEQQTFQDNHFLPGLFLSLERSRSAGQESGEVQSRYLELAQANLDIYRELLERAQHRCKEGHSGPVFQMLDFLFRQVKLAPDLHRVIGVHYLGLKEYDLAYQHLLQACCSAPDDPELLLQVAGAAIRIQRHSVAKALLEVLVTRLPADSPDKARAAALLDLARQGT